MYDIYYQNNKDKESLFLLYDFYKPLFLSSIKRCINKDSRLSVHREDLLSECIFVLEKLINHPSKKMLVKQK